MSLIYACIPAPPLYERGRDGVNLPLAWGERRRKIFPVSWMRARIPPA
jgi:hypothetical protein